MKHKRNSRIIHLWSTGLALLLSVNAVSASVPSCVTDGQGIYASNQARVTEVNEANAIAVVYLDNGLDAGLDIGMTASVFRGKEKIGSVILVASEQYKSAAVILDLQPSQSIQAGDRVRLNTFRNS